MTIKKYTTVSAHTLLLMVRTKEGRKVTCHFKGGSQPDSFGTYTSKDESVQRAIEGSALFGREIVIKSVTEREDRAEEAGVGVDAPVQAEKEPEMHDIVDIQTFKSLVACKAAMAEHGIDVAMIRSCAQAEETAKENGLNYTIKR